jgi:hypothetical protein
MQKGLMNQGTEAEGLSGLGRLNAQKAASRVAIAPNAGRPAGKQTSRSS